MRCLACYYDEILASVEVCPKCGVHLPSLMRDLLPPGTRLHDGKYEIVSALGRGGFGVAYKAVHCSLEQNVAIKEFYPQYFAIRHGSTAHLTIPPEHQSAYERGLQRFIREGKLLATLKHANVVSVQDLFEERGTAYMVMELIEGHSLHKELEDHPGRRLPPEQVEAIMKQLIRGLDKVHALDVYHLDLKPSNILLTPEGRVVLIDFGAARQGLSSKSTQAFTPDYAAPEVLAGTGMGPHSDIFELGMMLHEMLTGILPPSAFSRITGTDDWVPSLEEPWHTLVSTALRLNSSERPSNVKDWWAAATGASAAVTTPPTPPQPPFKPETSSKSQNSPVPVNSPASGNSPVSGNLLSQNANQSSKISWGKWLGSSVAAVVLLATVTIFGNSYWQERQLHGQYNKVLTEAAGVTTDTARVKSLEDLKNLRDRLQMIVTQLQPLRQNKRLAPDVDKVLPGYQQQLKQLEGRLKQEEGSRKQLQLAEQLAPKAHAGLKPTIATLTQSKANWQNAISALKKIPTSSLVGGQAKMRLSQYNAKLSAVDKELQQLTAESVPVSPRWQTSYNQGQGSYVQGSSQSYERDYGYSSGSSSSKQEELPPPGPPLWDSGQNQTPDSTPIW